MFAGESGHCSPLQWLLSAAAELFLKSRWGSGLPLSRVLSVGTYSDMMVK